MYKDLYSEETKAALKRSRDGWYKRNKQKQLERQLERRREMKELLRRYKRFLSCYDCGMVFKDRIECCDFHHLDPTVKEYTIQDAVLTSKRRLKAELKKCIPLCANCHRTRHKSLTGVRFFIPVHKEYWCNR